MSIAAIVQTVHHREDETGELVLVPSGKDPVGQRRLRFDNAPHDVTALNGLPVWGGASELMLGECKIARREGYTKIVFVVPLLLEAVAAYNDRRRNQ